MKKSESELSNEIISCKNLAIDLGASNIKIAGIVGNKLKLEQIKSLATNYSKDNKNTVILDGVKNHFGIGTPLIVRDKTKRRLLPESILLSYYKIYGKTRKRGENVNIALGVPINTYLSGNKIKAFSQSLDELKNVTLDGMVNNECVTITIRDIKICAEGYSAFGSLMDDIDSNNNSVIVDIGYKTVDVIAAEIVNHEWEITANFTITKAIWDIFCEIEKALFDMGIELSPEQIEQRLLNAPILDTGSEKIDLHRLLYKGESIIDYIYNQLDLQIQGLNSTKVYLIGGGAAFFKYVLGDRYPNIVVFDDINKLIFANVIGFLQQLEQY